MERKTKPAEHKAIKALAACVVAGALAFPSVSGCKSERKGPCNLGGYHFQSCPCLVDSKEKPDEKCAREYEKRIGPLEIEKSGQK
jgi:hypothetical protein